MGSVFDQKIRKVNKIVTGLLCVCVCVREKERERVPSSKYAFFC